MSDILSRELFADAAAGSAGALAAMTVLYPLDRIRTIKQLGDDRRGKWQILCELVDRHGLAGVYAGLRPLLTAVGTSNFVYFYLYAALKQVVLHLRRKRSQRETSLSTFANLTVASIAGFLNVLITTPLWVVYTRFAAGSRTGQAPYSGVCSALRCIARDEGLAALWSGMTPSLILVANPTVQFVAYERLKLMLLSRKLGLQHKFGTIAAVMPALKSGEYLLLGAFAKLIATLLTYPLQVVQTRLRAAQALEKVAETASADRVRACSGGLRNSVALRAKTSNNVPRYSGTADCIRKTLKDEGARGLYAGMDAKLIQTCLNSAFMFVCYEHLSRAMTLLVLRGKLDPKL